MASLKQAQYIREQHPEADVHIHYIDIRANGLLEDFYNDVQKDEKVHFHRGKVAKVFKDEASGNMVVESEDTLSGKLIQNSVEMVVLATGMEPTIKDMMWDRYSICHGGSGLILMMGE